MDVFCLLFGDGFVFGIFLISDDGSFGAEIVTEIDSQSLIQSLIQGRKHALIQQPLDNVFRFDIQLLGQLFYRDAFGQSDGFRYRKWLEWRGPGNGRDRRPSPSSKILLSFLDLQRWTVGSMGPRVSPTMIAGRCRRPFCRRWSGSRLTRTKTRGWTTWAACRTRTRWRTERRTSWARRCARTRSESPRLDADMLANCFSWSRCPSWQRLARCRNRRLCSCRHDWPAWPRPGRMH